MDNPRPRRSWPDDDHALDEKHPRSGTGPTIMILRVGLTGGMASGKSTVGRRFAELGATVIDADRVVHELYRPGAAGHELIVSRYGSEVLRDDGEIDRPRLSSMALSTPEGAQELNALIHPLVIEEEHRQIRELESRAEGDHLVIVEATLLLESGGRDRYQRVVVVDTDLEVQVGRAVSRGMNDHEARTRISRQMNRADRIENADYVIDSSGSLRDTLEQTDEVFARLSRDLSANK